MGKKKSTDAPLGGRYPSNVSSDGSVLADTPTSLATPTAGPSRAFRGARPVTGTTTSSTGYLGANGHGAGRARRGSVTSLASSVQSRSSPAHANLLPHAPTMHFAGRRKQIDEILMLLEGDHPVRYVLHGAKGVGKTELAISVMYELRQIRQGQLHLLWMSASSPFMLRGTFDRCIRSIHRDAKRRQADKDLDTDLFHQWLLAHTNYVLLVEDISSVEDYEKVLSFLPKDHASHIIFTSSVKLPVEEAQKVGYRSYSMKIERLPFVPSRNFVCKRLHWAEAEMSQEELASASSFISGLFRYPLSLQLASTFINDYIGDTSGRFREFLQKYCDMLNKLNDGRLPSARILGSENEDDDSISDGPSQQELDELSLRACVQLLFERVRNDPQKAHCVELLKLAAYMGPYGIHAELLAAALKGLREKRRSKSGRTEEGDISSLSIATMDVDNLHFAFDTLRHMQILVPSLRSNGILSMHPCMASAIRALHSDEDQRTWSARVVRIVEQCLATPGLDNAVWARYMDSHIAAGMEHVRHFQFTMFAALRLCERGVVFYSQRGRHENAEQLARMHLEMVRTSPDKQVEVARSLNNLGNVLKAVGKLEDAEGVLKEALRIAREYNQSVQDDNPNAGSSSSGANGTAEGSKGQFKDCFDESIILHNLGAVLHMQRRQKDAEALFSEALKIQKEIGEPDTNVTATILRGLSDVLVSKGRIAPSEDGMPRDYGFQNATAGRATVIGAFKKRMDSSASSSDFDMDAANRGQHSMPEKLHRIGVFLQSKGKLNEAEQSYRAAIEFENRMDVKDGSATTRAMDVRLRNLRNLALVLNLKGCHSEAEETLREILKLQGECGDEETLAYAATLNGLGLSLEEQGRFDEAEDCYCRAHKIWNKSLHPDNPNIAASLHNLGVFYHSRKNYKKAETAHRKALRIWQSQDTPHTPHLIASVCALVRALEAQGEVKEARSVLKAAARNREIPPLKVLAQGNLNDNDMYKTLCATWQRIMPDPNGCTVM